MKKTSVGMTTKKYFWLPQCTTRDSSKNRALHNVRLTFSKAMKLRGFILGLQKKLSVGVWNKKGNRG